MPYQRIPGTNVTYRPAAEAFADPKMRLAPNSEGGFEGYREDGWTRLGSLMPYITGGVMGYGALANAGLLPMAGQGAGGAASGASGAAGGVLPSSHLAGETLAAATQAAAPTIASQGASAGIPLGGLGAAAGGGIGSLLGNIGGKALDAITSDKGLASLASLIPLLASRGGGGGDLSSLINSMPQLNQMLDMSVQRAQRTDPLHQMVTRLAEQRMPIRSRG